MMFSYFIIIIVISQLYKFGTFVLFLCFGITIHNRIILDVLPNCKK